MCGRWRVVRERVQRDRAVQRRRETDFDKMSRWEGMEKETPHVHFIPFRRFCVCVSRESTLSRRLHLVVLGHQMVVIAARDRVEEKFFGLLCFVFCFFLIRNSNGLMEIWHVDCGEKLLEERERRENLHFQLLFFFDYTTEQ